MHFTLLVDVTPLALYPVSVRLFHVVMCPSRSVSKEFRCELRAFCCRDLAASDSYAVELLRMQLKPPQHGDPCLREHRVVARSNHA